MVGGGRTRKNAWGGRAAWELRYSKRVIILSAGSS